MISSFWSDKCSRPCSDRRGCAHIPVLCQPLANRAPGLGWHCQEGLEGLHRRSGAVQALTLASFHLLCPWPREILQEIQRLRLEHEQASQPTPEKAQQNPTLLAELRLLR